MKSTVKTTAIFVTLVLSLATEAQAAVAAKSDALIKSLQHKLEEELADGLLARTDIAHVVLAGLSSDQDDGVVSQSRLIGMLRGPLKAQVYLCDICDAKVIEREGSTEFRSAVDDLETVKTFVGSLNGSRRPDAALWVDIARGRLHYRLVAVQSGQVLSASTVTLDGDYAAESLSGFSRSRVMEIKARGDTISHVHWDLGVYPVPHIGFNFVQQWGSANHMLSGVALNVADPAGGVGLAHYVVLPGFRNALLGGKVLVDIPRLAGSAVSNANQESSAQLFSMAVLAKVPLFAASGALQGMIYASTNGAYGVGVSW